MDKVEKAKQRAARAKKLGLRNKGEARIQYVSKEKYSMFEDDLQEERKRSSRGSDNKDTVCAETEMEREKEREKDKEVGRRVVKKGGRPTKNFSEIGKRQRNRLIKEYSKFVMTKMEAAMKEVQEKYGERMAVVTTFVSVSSTFPKGAEGVAERKHTLTLDGGELSVVEVRCKTPHKCSDLEVAHHILHETVKGCISERSAQNILSAADGRVKAYKVKKLKKVLDSALDEVAPIIQLKEGCDAYYIEPHRYLQLILPHLRKNEVIGRSVTLCLSGDGRNMKVLREKSSIIISMKIITRDVYSTKYVIPIALAKGTECRENIEIIFSKLDSSLQLVKQGIRCGNAILPVRLTFCSDGKFLLMILGMKAANAHFSCPYCVLKKDKWLSCAQNTEYSVENDLRDPARMSQRIGQGACPAHSGITCGNSPHGVESTNLQRLLAV